MDILEAIQSKPINKVLDVVDLASPTLNPNRDNRQELRKDLFVIEQGNKKTTDTPEPTKDEEDSEPTEEDANN